MVVVVVVVVVAGFRFWGPAGDEKGCNLGEDLHPEDPRAQYLRCRILSTQTLEGFRETSSIGYVDSLEQEPALALVNWLLGLLRRPLDFHQSSAPR